MTAVLRVVPITSAPSYAPPPPIEPVSIPREAVPDPYLTSPPPPPKTRHDKLVGEMTGSEFADLMLTVLDTHESRKLPEHHQRDLDPGRHYNPITSVLYTVGNIGHGVIDIAEGMLRGAVDVVTFGYARRE